MSVDDRDLTAREVLFLVGALQGAGVRFWIDGGWGVDALLGRQTRPHDDLDVVIVSSDVEGALAALVPLHFVVTEDVRPVRLVVQDHTDRQIDFHPIDFDEAGTGWQRGAAADGGDAAYPADQLGTGAIEGRPVPCIGPQLQLAHHDGYAIVRAKERADIAALCAAFDLEPPPTY